MGFYYSTVEREVRNGARDVETVHIHTGWHWRAIVGAGPRVKGMLVGPFATEADALADARLADWED